MAKDLIDLSSSWAGVSHKFGRHGNIVETRAVAEGHSGGSSSSSEDWSQIVSSDLAVGYATPRFVQGTHR